MAITKRAPFKFQAISVIDKQYFYKYTGYYNLLSLFKNFI